MFAIINHLEHCDTVTFTYKIEYMADGTACGMAITDPTMTQRNSMLVQLMQS